MKFCLDGNVAEEEDDWEIIPANWWCTSFMAVSWSFTSKQLPRNKNRQFQGSLFVGLSSRLSSRFLSLNSLPSPSKDQGRISEEDNTLNLDLVGVKNAMDTVVGYERDVGFYFSNFPDLGLHKRPQVDLSVVIEESELEAGKDRWKEVVQDLMNGPAESDESLESSILGSYGDLDISISTLSSIDLTRSEASIDSIPMPSTPKPKFSFSEAEIKEPSPTGGSRSNSLQISPSRSLNASASSFVPNFFSKLTEEPLQFPSLQDEPKSRPDVHSPGPSFANFTFPSLNSTPSSVKIKKDDQGFFTEVQVEKPSNGGSASDLLPPFLQEPTQRSRTRKSRTREIVDRIRSRAPMSPEDDVPGSHTRLSAISPKYASHSPSPIGDEGRFVTPRLSMSDDGGDRPSRLSTPSCVDDEDGWIDIAQPTPSDSPSSQKSKRTRELFLALTRRRTDSSSSADFKDMTASSEISSGSESRNMSISPSPSPSPLSPPSFASNDGWIENSFVPPPELQKKAKGGLTHNRKKSSNNNNNHQHRNHHQHHSSRTSISSSTSQHPQRPFSATSPYPQLSPTAMSPQHLQQQPQMISPNPVAAFPYFFPTYPAVALPSPYTTAFIHVPTFPVVHAGPGGAAMAGVPFMAPALMPVRGVGVTSGKPTMSSPNTTPMHATSAYRAKHPPMW